MVKLLPLKLAPMVVEVATETQMWLLGSVAVSEGTYRLKMPIATIQDQAPPTTITAGLRPRNHSTHSK